MEILNFSETNSNVVVLQPITTIYDNSPAIITYITNGSFKVRVGCQSLIVTKDNIDKIIAELNKAPLETKSVNVIVLKGKKPSNNSLIFKEKSKSFYISTTGKAFDREKYSVVEAQLEIEPKFFSPASYTDSVKFGSYTINSRGRAELLRIASLIKSYFDTHK